MLALLLVDQLSVIIITSLYQMFLLVTSHFIKYCINDSNLFELNIESVSIEIQAPFDSSVIQSDTEPNIFFVSNRYPLYLLKY